MSGFTETALTAGRLPLACCLGPDGNVWYISNGGASRVCKITPGGIVTEYACPDTAADLQAICAGPDGNLWVIGYTSNKIYKVTTGGSFTSYSSGITAAAGLYTICSGPDGNLWFTEFAANKVGKITTSGTVTEYSSGITAGSQPLGIGSDGTDLWFTEYHTTNGNRVCRLTTSGTVTEYAITTGSFRPSSVVKGPDGRIWVGSFNTDKVLAVTVSDGTRTEYTVTSGTAKPCMLTVVADRLWALTYTDQKLVPITTAGVGGGAQTIPTGSGGAQSLICTGADGKSVWVAEYNNAKIAAYVLPAVGLSTAGTGVTDSTTGRNALTRGTGVTSKTCRRVTKVQRQAQGLYTPVFDGTTSPAPIHPTVPEWHNDATYPTAPTAVGTISGGKWSHSTTSQAWRHAVRGIPYARQDNGGGVTALGVGDFCVTAIVGYTTANSAYAAVIGAWLDANTAYVVRVGKGASGNTDIVKISGGTPTVVAGPTAKGIAINTDGEVKFLRDRTGLVKAYVDGTLIGSWTDPSPIALGNKSTGANVLGEGALMKLWLGAPSADGVSASGNYCKKFAVNSPANTVRVAGLTGTQAFQVLDAPGGSVIASSGTQSGGLASVDLAGLGFPLASAVVQVYTDDTYATVVDDGRFPASGVLTDLAGGEFFHYRPPYDVIGSDFVQGYPFFQMGKHSGIVQRPGTPDVFVGCHGNHGSVIVKQLNKTNKVVSSYEVAPIQSLEDQHENVFLVALSTGYLLCIYGGYTENKSLSPIRVRRTTRPWDISEWAAEENLGASPYFLSGDFCPVVDRDDYLHLVIGNSNVRGYDELTHVKRNPTTGAWSTPQVILKAAYHTPTDRSGTLAFSSTVNGSNVLTVGFGLGGIAASGVQVGDALSGTGIPGGTTVASITDDGHLVMSANATVTGNLTASFSYTDPDRTTKQYLFYVGDVTLGREPSGQQSVNAIAFLLDAYATPAKAKYQGAVFVKSENPQDATPAWRGLKTSAFSVPQQQNTNGTFPSANVEFVAPLSDSTYVSSLCMSADNETAYAVVPVLAMTPAADGTMYREHRLIKGTKTGGWEAPTTPFHDVAGASAGALEEFSGKLFYVTYELIFQPYLGTTYSLGTHPRTIQRYRQQGAGVFAQDTLQSPPVDDGSMSFYLARICAIPGSTNVNVAWVEWNNMFQGFDYTWTGQSAILVQEVAAIFGSAISSTGIGSTHVTTTADHPASDIPSGAITLGGSTAEVGSYDDSPSGTLSLAGTSTDTWTPFVPGDVVTGSLVLSGGLADSVTLADLPTYSLPLSGTSVDTWSATGPSTFLDAPGGAIGLTGSRLESYTNGSVPVRITSSAHLLTRTRPKVIRARGVRSISVTEESTVV